MRTFLAPLLSLLLLTSCTAQRPTLGTWTGPTSPAPVTQSDWTPSSKLAGQVLTTPHYRIYTTIESGPVRSALPQVMEGALAEYRKLAPGITPDPARPMDCFVFGRRPEWIEFTRANTGRDANIYLQITRGGYALRDWYVAYYIGDLATYSVACHEGWHQFVSRHFKGRVAPFLEEGIATTFESVQWENGRPRWNRSINVARAQSLRRVMDNRATFPLDQLITMHAGQIVDKSGEKIEAFYAQAWAFARFLWEADNARYRPALQRLLSDTAAGAVHDPTSPDRRAPSFWRPASVKPILEHYLDTPWQDIDRRYRAYMRKAAYDEFSGQFQS